MSDRCTRSNANAAWTCVLPEGHEGDHIYTLWSEIAIHAEAAIQRVRELHHNCATHHPAGCCHQCGGTYPCQTIRALEGDSND